MTDRVQIVQIVQAVQNERAESARTAEGQLNIGTVLRD